MGSRRRALGRRDAGVSRAKILHNDDSYARILDFMGKRRAELLARGELETPDRTGLFTTAIVSITTRGPIAIFVTGRKYAGENLADLLKKRTADAGILLLMSDALERNLPEGYVVDWAKWHLPWEAPRGR